MLPTLLVVLLLSVLSSETLIGVFVVTFLVGLGGLFGGRPDDRFGITSLLFMRPNWKYNQSIVLASEWICAVVTCPTEWEFRFSVDVIATAMQIRYYSLSSHRVAIQMFPLIALLSISLSSNTIQKYPFGGPTVSLSCS